MLLRWSTLVLLAGSLWCFLFVTGCHVSEISSEHSNTAVDMSDYPELERISILDPLEPSEVLCGSGEGSLNRAWCVIPASQTTKADMDSQGYYYKLTRLEGVCRLDPVHRKNFLEATVFEVTVYDPSSQAVLQTIDLAPILSAYSGYFFLDSRIFVWEMNETCYVGSLIVNVDEVAESDRGEEAAFLLVRTDTLESRLLPQKKAPDPRVPGLSKITIPVQELDQEQWSYLDDLFPDLEERPLPETGSIYLFYLQND